MVCLPACLSQESCSEHQVREVPEKQGLVPECPPRGGPRMPYKHSVITMSSVLIIINVHVVWEVGQDDL